MAGLGQDKTANRVAICSAIFAGFAYVGYAVVRKVLGREVRAEEPSGGVMGFFRNDQDLLGLEYEPCDQGRVFLRRLSGSQAGGRAAESFLDTQGRGLHSVLRPLSVRERIRELNLGAMAFTDTLLILHGKKAPLSGPRSLPSSTFHSPTRILSPGDLQLELLEREEQERRRGHDANDNSVAGSPKLSRHPSRSHLARRSLASSVVSLSMAEQEEADSRAEALCLEKEEELTRRLEGFQTGRVRELTPYESRSLVALLHCQDRHKIARTLVTVSGCAAFTRNQDRLREAGLLVRLPYLLSGPDPSVQLAAVMAAANLALNTANMKEMEQVVLALVLLAEDTTRESEFLVQTLLALTNTAVLTDWHHHYSPILPRLLHLWLSRQDKAVTFQALRLLVNLTCHDDTVQLLLSSPCPPGLPSLLTTREPEDRLLRSVTLLANLSMAAQRRGVEGPGEQGTFQYRLLHQERHQVWEAVQRLMSSHDNYDVRLMARKLYTVLDTLQLQ